MPATTKKLAKPAAKVSKPTAAKKVAAKKAAVKPAAAPVAEAKAPAAEVAAKKNCEELNEECVVMVKAAMDSLRGVVRLVRESTKAHNREVKEAMKKKKSKNENKAERSPAGFTKPCKIKDSLADFLSKVAGNSDVERGMELSRTDVTKRLNKYFVEKNLRDAADQRHILFSKDAELSKIISFDKDTKLTYFNLQSAIKDQFVTA